jgi:hypothetical protein
MQMRQKLILDATTLILLVGACKKENVIKREKEKFPIEYRFINNGDANVRDVVFYTTTFYPDDSIARNGDTLSVIHWNGNTFQNVGSYDTLRFTRERLGYKKCSTYLRVLIHFKQRMFSKLFADRGYYSGDSTTLGMIIGRTYISDTSVINTTSERIVSFKWPLDTLKYKEIIW